MLKNITYLSIFTTFVVLIWISLTVYHSFTSSTISQDVDMQILPLSPSFNIAALDSLKTRQQIPVNLSATVASPAAATRQIITPSVTVTPTVRPSQTPTSTPSANVTPGF